MKIVINAIGILTVGLLVFGCDAENPASTSLKSNQPRVEKIVDIDEIIRVDEMVVDAACGQCMLDEAGNGCDLAVRIKGQVYFVDGTSIDDHGDAHAGDGLCNAIRQARVAGKIEGGRFKADSFHLLDVDTEK